MSVEEVNHLHIPLSALSEATNGFSDLNLLGTGGFGNVYKGESATHGNIAIKMLDTRHGQGDHEFKTEIALLSVYKHENIVSLLGFCDEDKKKILVYKYESNGSLDKHLSSVDLTWIQRLHICIDAARGLQYLHDDVGLQHRILHRDVKSSNVLLDENWKAKVSDFGLSRLGPANVESTFVISNVCGTLGYIDPDYLNTGYLTQKSDVYSFGVVLFEVLCGRVARVSNYKERHHEFLVNLVKIHHGRNSLYEIIHPDLWKQIKTASLYTFSSIAYQCLMSGNERPTMKEVVQQLQKALDDQRVDNQLAPALSDDSFFTVWQKGVLLGRGSVGAVYECVNEMGYFFAVKEVSLLDDCSQGKESIMQLEHEISLLSQLHHENIVQYLGTDKAHGKLYIFLELAAKGSLAKLYQKSELPDSQVSAYTRQILSGLNYLHERKVVHRNIKCTNILVDASGSVMLADFGLAMETTLNDIKSCIGTANWMAPEVVRSKSNSGYGVAADIWSLGCTVLEMLTREIPYYPLEGIQPLYRIARGEPPPIPDTLSADARDFILRCLRVNPGDRPTAAQLLDHPFLRRRTAMHFAPPPHYNATK
ncbi:hypothetical protein QVD17_06150 [Tagetes erecta]|uniref:mitogen-activated protein kinase kinase kinase n=1 Tax=Tagetes erecta TaxID=13708 RepID=A0AAD8P644_TARER|nr:hypothetical protein QVD17_06150 [Tagetes erecta]